MDKVQVDEAQVDEAQVGGPQVDEAQEIEALRALVREEREYAQFEARRGAAELEAAWSQRDALRAELADAARTRDALGAELAVATRERDALRAERDAQAAQLQEAAREDARRQAVLERTETRLAGILASPSYRIARLGARAGRRAVGPARALRSTGRPRS